MSANIMNEIENEAFLWWPQTFITFGRDTAEGHDFII